MVSCKKAQYRQSRNPPARKEIFTDAFYYTMYHLRRKMHCRYSSASGHVKAELGMEPLFY